MYQSLQLSFGGGKQQTLLLKSGWTIPKFQMPFFGRKDPYKNSVYGYTFRKRIFFPHSSQHIFYLYTAFLGLVFYLENLVNMQFIASACGREWGVSGSGGLMDKGKPTAAWRQSVLPSTPCTMSQPCPKEAPIITEEGKLYRERTM